MSEPEPARRANGNVTDDSGLRCPTCQYNLTGLPEPRCPECGTTFDWEEVRQAAANPPRIAFERARGWRKVPGFLLTWLTVLFAPWVFARQITKRVSTAHALVFGGVCFLAGPVSLLMDVDDSIVAAWLTTGAICIVLQAFWLMVWDPHTWRAPRATLRFWLLAGCYTSAVMLTEWWQCPPILGLTDLVNRFEELWSGSLTLEGVYNMVDNNHEWLGWIQIGLWLLGLACCYAARLRRRRIPKPLIALILLLLLPTLLVLYATVVEVIGVPLWDLFGGSFSFFFP